MGYKAQAVGRQWENVLEYQANRDGVILVKQYPEVLFTGKGQAHIVSHAWVDYIGLYRGRGFTLEAKSTSNKSRFKAPRDRMHQFHTLQQVSGDVPAFYLVYWQEHGHVEVHLFGQDTIWPHWMEYGEGDVSMEYSLDHRWFVDMLAEVFGLWEDNHE